MFRSVLQRILIFSAFTAVVLALLMLDTDPPSWVPEAQAQSCTESQAFWDCYVGCGLACMMGHHAPACDPQTGCSCDLYCGNLCYAQLCGG